MKIKSAWLAGTEGEGLADVWRRGADGQAAARMAAQQSMHGKPLFPLGYGLTY